MDGADGTVQDVKIIPMQIERKDEENKNLASAIKKKEKASFVLTEYNGKIYVSARSIDEVNVQIIMERIGGGGHINMAGAQFPHTDMSVAITTLKQVIGKMIAEGDI